MSSVRAAVAVAALMVSLYPATVSAGVLGKQGVEMEGVRDRRGFYIGTGLRGGAYITGDAIWGAPRLELALGGGPSKKVTLGLNLHVAKYFGPHMGAGDGWSGGGDVEVLGFVYRGLYVGGGLGLLGAPAGADGSGLAAALGGVAGLGYEFFLNQRAALSIGLDYDLRVTTDKRLRHGPWLGIRFRFY